VFSPVFCAGLLFSSSFKRSESAAIDFGANLLGAMIGGVGEYLSLLEGYRFLLILVAAFYLAAVLTGRRGISRGHRNNSPRYRPAGSSTPTKSRQLARP